MVALSVAVPAGAQTKSAPPQATPTGQPAQEAPGGWDDETFEHQEFREEMARIRKEHEDLEAARDKLLDKCVNVSREQAEECNKERQELRERQAALHERTHAFHEKMRAAHRETPPLTPPAEAPTPEKH
jgi:ElaB/YqjD/DUF883 family membrane-anchored ribosome-binding protein